MPFFEKNPRDSGSAESDPGQNRISAAVMQDADAEHAPQVQNWHKLCFSCIIDNKNTLFCGYSISYSNVTKSLQNGSQTKKSDLQGFCTFSTEFSTYVKKRGVPEK